jgi:hypothetical protein
MTDKLNPQEIRTLAARIGNLVAEQLEGSLGSGRGAVGICGPAFGQCGSYECPKDFTCQAASFACTATFKDRVFVG